MKSIASVAFAIWAASSFALPQTGSLSASTPESTEDPIPAYVTVNLHLNNQQNSTNSTFNGVENINNKGDLANALGNSNPVIIAAMAGWCGPCKVITPYYTSLSDTYERIRFYRFDVDEVQDVAAELGIRAMPTFLMFSGWQKVAELVGAEPQKLLSMLEIYKGEFGIALLNGSATA